MPESGASNPIFFSKRKEKFFLEVGFVSLIVLCAILFNFRMHRYGIHGLGDVRWHMTWIQHFYHQLSEGILYPRWLAGTNFGYGSPTFVFYPPLIYYFGSFLKLIGLNIEDSIAVLVTFSIANSGVSFYLYASGKWGRLPALSGAIAYMISPVFLALINGGVLGFIFALAWIPLGLYLTEATVRTSVTWRLFISLSLLWFGLALIHLPSLLVYATAWSVYVLCSVRPWKRILKVLLSAPIGWALASFYIVPNLLEQKHVSIDYMLASQGGFKDEMLSIIGELSGGISNVYVQQFLTILALGALAYILSTKQAGTSSSISKSTIYRWLGAWLVIIFLMSEWAWPLWRLSPTLQKIETTFRLAGLLFFIEAVFFSLAACQLLSVLSLVSRRSPKILKVIPCILIVSIGLFLAHDFLQGYRFLQAYPTLQSPGNGVVPNEIWVRNIVENPYVENLVDVPEYRPFKSVYENSIPEKETYSDSGIPETGAVNQQTFLPTPMPGTPRISIRAGESRVSDVNWKSYKRSFKIEAETDSVIGIRTYYYPAWHLTVDGASQELVQAEDGTLEFSAEAGVHQVELSYRKTTPYKLGIFISVVTLGALVLTRLILTRLKLQARKRLRVGN
ncbi:MAG: hypothetical protein AAF651_00365 [Cyanobacteria bacterium P01_C01_bin.73]